MYGSIVPINFKNLIKTKKIKIMWKIVEVYYTTYVVFHVSNVIFEKLIWYEF